MPPKKNLFLGVLLSLLSFFCLSSTNAIVKLINNRINPFQILTLQSFFGFLVIVIISITLKKNVSFFKSQNYKWLFLRSLAGVGAFYFVFIALHHLSVADATLLLNTGPFFVPFLLLLFFKEPIDHWIWIGVIIGFFGLIFILKPGATLFQWDALFPLISGVCVVLIYISLRALHHHKEPMLKILFFLFLFATLLTLPFALAHWKNPSLLDTLYLTLIAVSSFLSQTTITLGLRYGSPKALAPLCYTSVVFAIFFDWAIWEKIPTWVSLVGILLVTIGGLITLFIENRSAKKRS